MEVLLSLLDSSEMWVRLGSIKIFMNCIAVNQVDGKDGL